MQKPDIPITIISGLAIVGAVVLLVFTEHVVIGQNLLIGALALAAPNRIRK